MQRGVSNYEYILELLDHRSHLDQPGIVVLDFNGKPQD